MVHANGLRHAFAAGLIGYHNIAGKILGHPRVVKINVKLFQFQRKRQLLQQQALIGIDKRRFYCLPLHHFGIGAKR